MDETRRKGEDLTKDLDNAEITELDEQALELVAGGIEEGAYTNGNCDCPAGATVPSGSGDNGNCGCHLEA
jgi:hypothetical protein